MMEKTFKSEKFVPESPWRDWAELERMRHMGWRMKRSMSWEKEEEGKKRATQGGKEKHNANVQSEVIEVSLQNFLVFTGCYGE